MEVNIKASYLINPSEPTWEGVSSLSEWDQTGVVTHVPTIYFYNPSKVLEPPDSMINTLKDSLSRTLVHFYPLAGRVRWIGRGRLELLCNGSGVELVKAESNSELTEFGDFSSKTAQFERLIPYVDYDKPIDELPLVLAQLTMFRCGSVSLGVTISHIVADGQSALQFMNAWASITRGGPLEVGPYIDYKLLQSRTTTSVQMIDDVEFNPTPLIIGEGDSLKESKKPTTISILPLGKDDVDNLKKVANEGLDHVTKRPYSRFEVVAAHVWRSACKARRLRPEQPTGLGFSVDVRRRLSPPLPENYFGNAIQDVVAVATVAEVGTMPLGSTCGKIREGVEKVNNEYVWANIEYLKKLGDLSKFQDIHSRKGDDGPFYGNPNIGVISWLSLPIYGLDFGWGKEIYMGPGTHDSDGDCLVLPGSVGDGSLKVALCLQIDHILDFKKYFYEDIFCDE